MAVHTVVLLHPGGASPAHRSPGCRRDGGQRPGYHGPRRHHHRLAGPPVQRGAAPRGVGPARYTRPAMTHVFVAPHPDDVALSCGGLIASLRELGQNVAILTVFSGNTESTDLTTYQREALGFGG